MENMTTYPAATPESVWEAFRESDRQRKENERILNEKFAETDRQLKESRANFEESRADFDRRMKKSDADFDRRMKIFEDTVGSWSNNMGFYAEEYFFNSFEKGKRNFFGEKFDEIEKNVKGLKNGFKDEYDVLLLNGKSVGIVEVKFRAHKNDIPRIINKADTFRKNFPDFANHQVFIGLATLSFSPALEQECINKGIAIVKQVGETIIINDKHLKVF
jgi:hypothetical protein